MLIEHLQTKHLDLLVQLPKEQLTALLALETGQGTNADALGKHVQAILDEVDWTKHRKVLGNMMSALLPIERLVPECYADWRPIVSDAISFIGIRLSSKRLIPKLIEQLLLAEYTPLEQRLILFIAKMPSLQKLGQVIARNRNLDPAFRTALSKLENEIQDVEPEQIKIIIQQQLGPLLKKHKVEIKKQIHAEASVCALQRFSWLNPESNKKEQGVFKVLKPHLKDYFKEEMELLLGLADFLESKKEQHALANVNLRAVFEDIRSLLEQELDSEQEMQNLKDAYSRYQNINGVRIPKLISTLSAPGIIAMSYETGKKITDAFANNKKQQHTLSTQIIEALIAHPLFSTKEEAIFHADPHAGNLFVDETTHELILFDWALTERLDFEQRRKIILLISALTLRDEKLIQKVIMELSDTEFSKDPQSKHRLQQQIKKFMTQLALFRLPSVKDVLTLLDTIILDGIQFSRPLLIFRKVLLTLDGVLHDVYANVSIETDITQLVLEHLRDEMFGINLMQATRPSFQIPLTPTDTYSLIWSAQWYYLRNSLRASEQWFKLSR
jgi:ubiquinone biosynthesis protein